MSKGEIIIYQTHNGKTSIDVTLEDGTVWLTQAQIAVLFGTKRPAITKHLGNIYKSKELIEDNTCSILEHVGNNERQKYTTKYYNLDAILSVGYRVNSINATQFRIWANGVLKDYLIKGFAINQKSTKQQLSNLSNMVQLLSDAFESKKIEKHEAQTLLKIIKDYSYALQTIDSYDYQKLQVEKITNKDVSIINYSNALKAIRILKTQFGGSELFGREKDDSFKSSLSSINQTFDAKELYPSIEEKASMLLYLVVKNHSFIDGNKRIAAFLFLWFLQTNHLLYKPDGSRLIENNSLVALTIMIAQSNPDEKDIMLKLLVNLINKNN